MDTRTEKGFRLTAATFSKGSRVSVSKGHREIGYLDKEGWHLRPTAQRKEAPNFVKADFPSICRESAGSPEITEEIMEIAQEMLAKEIIEDAERQKRGEAGIRDYTW